MDRISSFVTYAHRCEDQRWFKLFWSWYSQVYLFQLEVQSSWFQFHLYSIFRDFFFLSVLRIIIIVNMICWESFWQYLIHTSYDKRKLPTVNFILNLKKYRATERHTKFCQHFVCKFTPPGLVETTLPKGNTAGFTTHRRSP